MCLLVAPFLVGRRYAETFRLFVDDVFQKGFVVSEVEDFSVDEAFISHLLLNKPELFCIMILQALVTQFTLS